MFYDKKFSSSSKFFSLEPGLYHSITDIVEAMNTLIQERRNPSENCIKVKVCRRTKKLRFTSQVKDLGHIFGSNVVIDFGVMLRGERPHKPEFAYDIVRIHFLDIHRPDRVQYHWRHESSIAALLSFYFEAQGWRHYNYWTVHELSDI